MPPRIPMLNAFSWQEAHFRSAYGGWRNKGVIFFAAVAVFCPAAIAATLAACGSGVAIRLDPAPSCGTPSKKKVSHLRLPAELHPAVSRRPRAPISPSSISSLAVLTPLGSALTGLFLREVQCECS